MRLICSSIWKTLAEDLQVRRHEESLFTKHDQTDWWFLMVEIHKFESTGLSMTYK